MSDPGTVPGFDEAYRELFVRALRAADRIVRDRGLAEDIAAETMARAYARWAKVGGYASAWVTRVAVNQALDVVRRGPAPVVVPRAGHESLGDRLVLEGLLATLPRRQREAVVLRFVLDLDERETARVLGISVATVHTHVMRALDRLRVHMTTSNEGGEGR